jgi:biotin operon repressor
MSNGDKIYPNDVLQLLLESQNTKAMCAEKLNCSISTIEKNLRELRKDGHSIIHNQNGLKAITRQMIDDDPELGKVLEDNVDWFLNILAGLQRLMIAHKPLFPAMKRAVNKLGWSKEERMLTAKACAKTVTLLVMLEAQEEDE